MELLLQGAKEAKAAFADNTSGLAVLAVLKPHERLLTKEQGPFGSDVVANTPKPRSSENRVSHAGCSDMFSRLHVPLADPGFGSVQVYHGTSTY